ncbi:16S rRNA (guanine(966)-N(2))-methyltransferase RsmD [Pontivivens nitratireducens]|uniref:16S rRNA (Guanine(966)-N(2))-methyltransferase RsmD n=1 Tax=Pontivivens nitratireducens TaxID=2758038 RepID=A0A6G7VHD7_9RHOB|nr:16S rRNA (guanine(966)-N(2))-methyltransferase RsmD [Pontibrevibacter nitratireducens]QIK39404.1 16S rRNA (guanine(966)-N(2))-methyltransferase RsmD [Pontibrevibacter nitratireducens]
MRIVGGEFRGRALAALGKGDAAAHLRPTTDRVRETLFNILRAYDLPQGARVLDLFAGTGALGLEALSRGAVHLTAVDNGAKASSLLRRNVEVLGVPDRTRIIRRDARKLFVTDTPNDLIFLDPPYGRSMGTAALTSALDGGWIAPDALIVWEEATPQPVPVPLREVERRSFGDTSVQFLTPD